MTRCNTVGTGRVSGGIRWAILALALALCPASPLSAATFDFEDLLAPQLRPDAAPSGPALNPAIDAELRDMLAAAANDLAAGDFKAAETGARKVTEAAPQAAEGWHLLGLALANLGQMDDALAALGKAGELYQANAEPYIIQGDILLSLDRRAEAKAAYETAIARDPSDWRGHESLAILAEQAGDPTAAMAQYQLAMDAAPADRLFPRMQLARLSLASGDPQRVVDLLTDSAAETNAPDPVLEYLARAELTLGNRDPARTLYGQLVARGTSLRGYIGLAGMDTGEQKIDEAEDLLLTARTKFPEASAVDFELGNLYGATQRYDEALAAYEAGLKIDPESPDLMKGASIAEMRLGKLDAALARAVTLAGRPTASGGDYAWLASLQEMTGAKAEAANNYAKAVELDPANWLALNNLASLLVDTDPAQALSLAERAAALAPQVPAVQDTLAWAAFKAGDVLRASEIYEGLQKASPDDPVLLYRLGMVRLAEGRRDEGRAMIEAALKADPDFSYSADARAALQQD